jgi:hypothetical protein
MQTIAKKYDIPYLSPADLQLKDEWFIDGCHLTEPGERVKAEWILDGVVRALDNTSSSGAGLGAPAPSPTDDRHASVHAR